MKNQRTEVYLFFDNNYLFTVISKLSKEERKFVKELTAYHSDFKDRELIIYGASNEAIMIQQYQYVMGFSQCFRLRYHPMTREIFLPRFIALTNFAKYFLS
jgi:hypothetical protein